MTQQPNNKKGVPCVPHTFKAFRQAMGRAKDVRTCFAGRPGPAFSCFPSTAQSKSRRNQNMTHPSSSWDTCKATCADSQPSLPRLDPVINPVTPVRPHNLPMDCLGLPSMLSRPEPQFAAGPVPGDPSLAPSTLGTVVNNSMTVPGQVYR